MPDSEVQQAQTLVDRTTRLNDRLRKLAARINRRGSTAAERSQLASDRARALALGRDARTQIASNRSIRDSLTDANASLAAAASALRSASRGDRAALLNATHLLQAAARRTRDAANELAKHKSGSASHSRKPVPAGGAPAPVQLPSGAALTIQPPVDGTISSLADGGDVNGDGSADLLVGATLRGGGGTSYVLFGGKRGSTVDLGALGSRGLQIPGGNVARPAGDLDGDGKSDVLLSQTTQAGSSTVYAIAGTASLTQTDPSAGGALATISVPTGSARCGTTAGVTAVEAGDVNGDSSPDVLVTAPCYGTGGAAWVVFGPWPAGRAVDVANLGGQGFEVHGAQASGRGGLGTASDAGQDLNRDGKPDIVLSEPGRVAGSAIYVIFGTSQTSTTDVNHLGTAGYALTDSGSGTGLGTAVAEVGDMNGDGASELLVGKPASGAGRDSSGAAYVVFGERSPRALDVASLGSRGFKIFASSGKANSRGLGSSGAAVGDVNRDGTPDVVLGSPGLRGTVAAYVVYGKGSRAPVDFAHLGRMGIPILDQAPPTRVAVGGGSNVAASGQKDVVVAVSGADGTATGYVVAIRR